MIPSQAASSRRWPKQAESPISAISPSAVRVAIPRNARSFSTCQPHPLILGDLLELGVERSELAVQAVEVDQHLHQRLVREQVSKPLAADARAWCLAVQDFFALTEHVPVAQQLLADPVTGRGPGAADVIAAAQQIPQSLGLPAWVAAPEPGAAPRSTGSPASRWHRDGRSPTRSPARTGVSDGGPHVTRDPHAAQQPPQREPAGAGLVADRQPLPAAEPLDRSDGSPSRWSRSAAPSAGRPPAATSPRRSRACARRARRTCAHRQWDRANVRHGWSSTGRMRLSPLRTLDNRDCPTRERCDEEDQPHASILTNDREDHDRGADIRDDEQQLQQSAEQDLSVVPSTDDVPLGCLSTVS